LKTNRNGDSHGSKSADISLLRICVIALTSEVILHSCDERILRMVQVNVEGTWVDLLASLTANFVDTQGIPLLVVTVVLLDI